jgi:hypothetical protein
MNGIYFLSAEPAFLADEQRAQDDPFWGYAVRWLRRGVEARQDYKIAWFFTQRQGVLVAR